MSVDARTLSFVTEDTYCMIWIVLEDGMDDFLAPD